MGDFFSDVGLQMWLHIQIWEEGREGGREG